MGADIAGDGTSTIMVRGVSKLEGCEHAPIPDRIEAGTYILAGVATRSSIAVEGARPDHLEFFLEKLRQAGGQFEIGDGVIVVAQEQRLKGIDVPTMPYPGFPTDLQPQMMAALATADGLSIITENVFENRFLHADELVRMGADIDIKGSHAVVRGVETLYGVPVRAADLRGGAALVIAALGARGVTEIRGVNHIMRGYENLVEKLRGLGADVRMEVTESGSDLETGD
jgi:UDP-N-acetylglucosamine 1-carboxyvinyltransferase